MAYSTGFFLGCRSAASALAGPPASDGDGENWAVIASLIETCKLNGVDPYAYLVDEMKMASPAGQRQIKP